MSKNQKNNRDILTVNYCWGEITAVNKVERMRDAVKRLEARIVNLEGTIGGLRRHKHLGDEIVCKLEQSFDTTGMYGSVGRTDVYF